MSDSDEVWKRSEIESPCIKVCVTHPDSGLCMGCYRSRDEIAGWSRMTPEARKSTMATLPERAHLVKGKRRGGRLRRDG
jgi:predicted Fe-S protein YdhL (DUF1289 family)